MFTAESQRLAAEKIAEIKAKLKSRKDPKPVPVVVPADDDPPF